MVPGDKSPNSIFDLRPTLGINLTDDTLATELFGESGEYGLTRTTGPDKTAPNDAITKAETLYDSIKGNTDYTDIASALETAINTAMGVA